MPYAKEELERAAQWWDHLADEETDWAAYEESMGRYGGVSRNKAETYRKAARSLRMQAEDGVVRCACHLVTYEECRKLSEKKGS